MASELACESRALATHGGDVRPLMETSVANGEESMLAVADSFESILSVVSLVKLSGPDCFMCESEATLLCMLIGPPLPPLRKLRAAPHCPQNCSSPTSSCPHLRQQTGTTETSEPAAFWFENWSS